MAKAVRKGLSPTVVLDAAFAIVDADGADALTMRRLAASLGVAAMAIYNHFADRDAILDALAERAFSMPVGTAALGAGGRKEVLADREASGRGAGRAGARPGVRGNVAGRAAGAHQAGTREPAWRERIFSIVMGVNALAVRHPHIYRLAITRPTKPESALRLMSEAMGALREAGLNDAQAVVVYHTIVMLMQGFPFWLEGAERHCNLGEHIAREMGSDSAVARDWKLVHGVDMHGQFELSLRWMLDAVERAPVGTGVPVNTRELASTRVPGQARMRS